jgi:hypothetical protein
MAQSTRRIKRADEVTLGDRLMLVRHIRNHAPARVIAIRRSQDQVTLVLDNGMDLPLPRGFGLDVLTHEPEQTHNITHNGDA